MTEGIDEAQSVLIGIRHGDTKYTNEFPDLTPMGIAQIQQSAEQNRNLLNDYRRFITITSPAVRTQGSSQIFKEALGIDIEKETIDPDIAPYKIHDLSGFLDYIKDYESADIGRLWLEDPFFDSESNHLTEKRSDVNQRAFRFLGQYIASLAKETVPTCTFFHSHFEILVNFMGPLYDCPGRFPIEREPGPQNGEAIRIQADQYNPRLLTIMARSKSVKTIYNSQTGIFEMFA